MHALPEARFWEAMERRYGRNPNMVCEGAVLCCAVLREHVGGAWHLTLLRARVVSAPGSV